MGMVRIFKCVWKKPLMFIYMVNVYTTTKIWMYNWVLQTQEMLVVKQVLGIAKKSACPRQRADLIFCTLVNFMLFLRPIGPGLSVGLFDNVKKKKLPMYLRGSMPVMPLRPSQKPYWVYTYRESNFISFSFHTSEDTRRLTRTYMRCKQTAAQASVVTERNGILDSVQESYWHACMCTDYSAVQYTKGDITMSILD